MRPTAQALCLIVLAWLHHGSALAAVTPAEAEALKGRLTPVGAERAGNADNSIPAWSGGYTTVPAGYKSGDPRPDPFAGETPLLQITAQNVGAHADKLPEGARALFARFPDYRMNVYPSHRTAAAPSAVYENIFRNATSAKAVKEGLAMGVEGAAGGVPFPIPQVGLEAVWNHLLAYWGVAREARLSTYVVTKAGIDRSATYREIADFPYYRAEAKPGSFGPYYFKTSHVAEAPAAKYGEAYLAWQPINIARDRFAAWRYLPGERRVRRGPSLSYDTPDPEAGGAMNLDEYYMFFGGPDRYDWKLVGKREMYVPYNNNGLPLRPVRDVLGPAHANPDALRYELHRVWVVEGTLAKGKNHVAPRRRLYIDEDTWLAVYSESWDDDGRLWKFAHASMYLAPDVPAVVPAGQFTYDLIESGYVYSFAFNEEQVHYKVTAPPGDTVLSPEGLAAETAR